MPAVNLSLPFTEALVQHMRANAGLTVLVAELEIYGEKVRADHATTFTKIGYPTITPFLATGINGNQIEFRIHTFTQGLDTRGIGLINAAVVAALDDASIAMDEGWSFDVTFVRSSVINDTAENSAYHGLNDFVALVGVDA